MPKSISSTRLRALAFLALIFLAIFVLLQFIRPALPNPPVVADLQAPAEVKAILRTSCYNCHSNETQVPWFDKVVPAYWLVVRDVERGRQHMNFSDFGQMPAAEQKGFLYESVNQIQLGAMPPANYKFVHPDSAVTPAQLDVLKKYLHPSETSVAASPSDITAADDQYQKWIAAGQAPAANVQPALNGLGFFPDYKNWKPVSTTDRFDNGTMRVILGNDVATRAIADNKVHPWPDGTTFAKIAWKQQADTSGQVPTGAYVQVEFMTKDATKYASTEGWGFGRWRGVDHKPYGKDANFAMECASCHRPMEANDFVYTMPIHDAPAPTDLFNREAALPDDLPYQPLQWRVITSQVDKQRNVMSTLYGNDPAVDHARTAPQTPYPAGAVLALVTWNQQEDRHWFGGRIPGKVLSIEFVTVNPAPSGPSSFAYQSYEGSPVQKAPDKDATLTQSRIDAITGMKAAVMP